MSKVGDDKFKKDLDDLVNVSSSRKKPALEPKQAEELRDLIEKAKEKKKVLFSDGEKVMTFVKASEAILMSLTNVQEKKGGVDPSDVADMILAILILFDDKKIIKIL